MPPTNFGYGCFRCVLTLKIFTSIRISFGNCKCYFPATICLGFSQIQRKLSDFLLGSEVTLVAGSDTSEDSMDSLDNQKITKIPKFVILEPSENQPSITRGIGRKSSTENENPAFFNNKTNEMEIHEEFFPRRNSDKSSCYSDDSLSNDSLSIGNQSPSSSSNTQSSHAYDTDIRNKQMENFEKMQINQELNNAGTGNFKIFQNLNLTLDSIDGTPRFLVKCDPYTQNHLLESFENAPKNSGSYEFQLSEVCSKLESTDILELVKKTINSQVPKVCVLKTVSEEVSDKLSLEYEGGIQIELKIIDDKEKESKGLKMRRVSGDYLIYNQLCQQLISCMTVS